MPFLVLDVADRLQDVPHTPPQETFPGWCVCTRCRPMETEEQHGMQPETGKHLSIIVDNMDQAISRPPFCTHSKSHAHLHMLQHHITGLKVHNLNKTYLLTWTDALRPVAKVTLKAVVHILSDISKNPEKVPRQSTFSCTTLARTTRMPLS